MNIRSMTIAAACIMSAAMMVGCNGVGAKDSLVARFNDESVYEEDLFLVEKNIEGTSQKLEDVVFDNLYSKAAAVAVAKSEYPELEKEWNDYYRMIEPRVLMTVFQRYYAVECLMFTDVELRRFYDSHKSLFESEGRDAYIKNRYDVASLYYVHKNPEAFAAYVEQTQNGYQTDVDSLALKKAFADSRRRAIRDSVVENVVKNSGFVTHALPNADLKAFYEQNKEKYKTEPGYVLYHVQMGDSAALAAKVKDNLTLDQFKAAAVKYSTNKVTAQKEGFVGFVKNGYCLPYEIGVVRELPSAVEGKNPGFITGVLQTEGAPVYHRFYLAENVESAIKPFDRVAKIVERDAGAEAVPEVADDYALITSKDGKTVFSEKDVKTFFDEYYDGGSFNKNAHDRIVKMFQETFAYAEAAMNAKLNLNWEFRALSRSIRLNFMFERYVTKKLSAKDLPEDSLKSLYERVGNPIHSKYSFEQSVDDLKLVAGFPKNVLAFEYYFGYDATCSGMTYDQCVGRIYTLRKNEVKQYTVQRLLTDSYGNVAVHIYNQDGFEKVPATLSEKIYATIDSLKNANGKINMEYRKLMWAYPENDSMFQNAVFDMAQVHNDYEDFTSAEKEYYAYYRMWPESENSEKAMFSRGFILSENLKKDSLALEVFREFVAKYPNSELKESAEWLAKNIESNGKLSEDLLKKIEAEQ